MITLHVEAETMNELILKATDALYGHTAQEAEHLYMALSNPAAPVIPAAKKEPPRKAPESPVSAPEPKVEETPDPEPAAATSAKPAPTAAAKTLPEMREIISKAVQQPGGRETLADFLKEHGVKKLPELDPAHYDDLLTVMAPFKEAA